MDGVAAVLVDETNRVGYGANLLGLFILDFEVELLLHRHDHLDQVEGIGVEISDEL
jgi:hypothetical protein